MAKKFYDNNESKRIADLELSPYSHFLYMILRVSLDQSRDCGLFKVTVKEMISITGMDRSVITGVLLPELIRHDLITYDNSVLFIPGTPQVEGFEGKLHGNNPHQRTSFINALRNCETVVSAISGHGGVNLAVKKFVEYWSDSIDLLISDISIIEHELNELEEIDRREPANSERTKKIFALKKSISEFFACKTILARKNSYSNSQPNPSGTHAEPIAENSRTHREPMPNPSGTHAEPIIKNPPTPLGNWYMGNGIWDKKKKEELPFSEEGAGETGFARGESSSGAFDLSESVFIEPGAIGAKTPDYTHTDPPGSTGVSPANVSTGAQFPSNTENGHSFTNNETHNLERKLHGQSLIENVLASNGVVHLDSFYDGVEDNDSEFLEHDDDNNEDFT